MDTTRMAGKVVRAAFADPTSSEARTHEQLIQRILPRLHNYYLRLVGAQEAEDCLQEVLVLLEQSLAHRTYDPQRSFNAWVWLKARTVWAQWCRRRQRRVAAELTTEPAQSDRLTRAVERDLDAHELLNRVREELGDETYELFLLYYEGGLTQEELGEVVGRDPKTIRKRLKQAHALLERALDET